MAKLGGPATATLTLARYMLDPYGVFPALLARYGDPFHLPLPGSPGTIVTGHPEGVRAIIGADPDTFEPWRIEATAILLGEQSLFLQKGERHRAARKLLTPPFAVGATRGFAGMMRELARAGFSSWDRGGRVRVQDTTQQITLSIIVRALFGARGERAALLERTLADGLDSLGPAILYLKFLRRELGGFGPWARALRMVGKLRELLLEEIASRRAGGGPGGDVLTGLVAARFDDGTGMTDVEIRDRLSDIVVAGHETSAVALSWLAEELGRHPVVRARLDEELQALHPDADPAEVAALPYLDAVCQEVLRLHPPLVFLTRRVVKPLELRGRVIEPGCGVSMAVRAVHTHAGTFDDPLAFAPERFLDRSYAAHELLPFGGGAKRCIGAAFGMMELKQIAFEMLRRYELELVSTKPAHAAARTITVCPRGGVLSDGAAAPDQLVADARGLTIGTVRGASRISKRFARGCTSPAT